MVCSILIHETFSYLHLFKHQGYVTWLRDISRWSCFCFLRGYCLLIPPGFANGTLHPTLPFGPLELGLARLACNDLRKGRCTLLWLGVVILFYFIA